MSSTATTGALASNVDFTGNVQIDALIVGSVWGQGPAGHSVLVSYSFPSSSSDSFWDTQFSYFHQEGLDEPFAPGFAQLNGLAQASVTAALTEWGNVANVSFFEVDPELTNNVGDIRVAFTDGGIMVPNTFAYTFTPGFQAYQGDVWINPHAPVASGDDFNVGKNGWETLIHELGHAIGMDHPTSLPSFPASLDTFKYTVMSYNDAPGHEDQGTSSIYPTTPMLLDIQAIQYLYGANMSYHAGPDTYTFNEGDDYYQTIWDAGGTDTIQYNSVSDGAVIDLREGFFSQLGNAIQLSNLTAQQDDVAIAFNAKIENATGGGGADTITGNALANVLIGNGGNDDLTGAAGDDTLQGGAGDDSIDGGAGNDSLDGGKGADTLIGGAGNDTFVVTTGDGIVEMAGGGSDTVLSALNFTLGVNVENLTLSGNAKTGTGSAVDNAILGNAKNNTLDGGAGNDTLDGGAGFDTLIGGAGNDTYYVDSAADRIRELPGGGTDTVHSTSSYYQLSADVENLVFDTGAGNQGFGNDGNNALTGNAGSDTLSGGLGNDVLTGGTGADTFVFNTAPGGGNVDTITDFASGTDHLRFENAIFSALGAEGALAAGAFHSGNFTSGQDADDRLVYNTTSGALYYDADGSGAGAAVQVAVLAGHPALLAADIQVS